MNSKTLTPHSYRLKVVAPLIKTVSPDVAAQSWKGFMEHLREGWKISKGCPGARSQEAIEDLFDLLAEMEFYPFTHIANSWHRLTKFDQGILSALIVGTTHRWLPVGLAGTTFLPFFKFLSDIGMPIWKHKDTSAILVGDVDATLSDTLANHYTSHQPIGEDEWTEMVL